MKATKAFKKYAAAYAEEERIKGIQKQYPMVRDSAIAEEIYKLENDRGLRDRFVNETGSLIIEMSGD